VRAATEKGADKEQNLVDGHLEGLPQFSPERFAVIRCRENARRKQMAEGLEQLADEGAIQVFTNPSNLREPILVAIGELQFDVARFRLETEYAGQSHLNCHKIQ